MTALVAAQLTCTDEPVAPFDSVDELADTTSTESETAASRPPEGWPVASFTFSCEGLTCTFTSTSTDDVGIINYVWISGGESGFTPVWTKTYASAGTYEVVLQVMDTDNQVASVRDSVTVTSPVLAVTVPALSGTVGTAISGTATATGGTPPYAFSKTSGPSWLSVAADGTIGGRPDSVGSFEYGVTVTDSVSATATATDTVTVAAYANQPPMASFTASCDSLACSFDGSASSDPNAGDSIASYAWSAGDGTSLTGQSANHTYASAGTYQVTLTVFDAHGLTDDTTTSVTVPPPVDQPPVADFTTSCDSLTCTFTSTSTDDVGITGYQWSAGTGTARAGIIPVFTWTYDRAGTYTVSLIVADSAGQHARAEESITVPMEEAAPLAVTAPALSGTVGTAISGTATATGGTPPYAFSKASGPTWLSVATDGTISGTPESAGRFAYRVTVTDSGSATATAADTLAITARLAVTAPSVSGTVGTAISGTATATGGTPPYTFSKASGPDSLNIAADGTISGTFAVAGSFAYTVTVVDEATPPATATATDTITLAAANRPPVADFTWTCENNPLLCTFDGSPSSDPDPGDSIVSYAWRMGDSANTSLSGERVSHTYDSAGVYTITLRVTDTGGLTGSKTVSPNLSGPEHPPDSPAVRTLSATLPAGYSLASCSVQDTTQLSQDGDRDGILDDCEYELAKAFRPTLIADYAGEWSRPSNRYPHWIVTRGIPDRSAYAKYAPSYTLPGDVIGIYYALSYYEDPGFDGGGGDHHGDSEMIVLWVRNTSGSTYTLEAAFLSAHYLSAPFGVNGDRSTMAHPPYFGGTSHTSGMSVSSGAPTVWVSRENHANYPTRSKCDQKFQRLAGLVGIWTEDCYANDDQAAVAVDSTRNLGSQHSPIQDCVFSPRNSIEQECYWTGTEFSGWRTGTTEYGFGTRYRGFIDTFAPHGQYSDPPTPVIDIRCDDSTCSFSGAKSADDFKIDSYSWKIDTWNESGQLLLPSFSISPIVEVDYASSGAKTVRATLTVHDVFGHSATTNSESITLPPLDVSLGATCDSTLTCAFQAGGRSEFGIASYAWDFGDTNDTVSTTPSVSHQYRVEGTYTVRLRATDRQGNVDSASAVVAVGSNGGTGLAVDFNWSCEILTCSFVSRATVDGESADEATHTWSLGVTTSSGDPVTETGDSIGYTYGDAGRYDVTLTVKATIENRDTTVSVTKPVTVAGPLRIDVPELSGTASTTFSATATAAGGKPPYRFSKEGSPDWLAVDSISGIVTAKPAAADTGNFEYIVIVSDSVGSSASDTANVTVTPPPMAPDSLSVAAPRLSGTAGTTFSDTAKASGGVMPYSFGKGDDAPGWLTVDRVSGIVTARPAAAVTGSFAYTVIVTDGADSTASDTDTVKVMPPAAEPDSLIVTAPALSGTAGDTLTGTATASEGVTPYTFTLENGPSWVSVHDSTGLVTATPQAGDTGTVTYVVKARDRSSPVREGIDSATITVAAPPPPCAALSVTAPDVAVPVGTAVADNVTVTGGCPPNTFAKTSGPSWLSISSSGGILGTPQSAGNFPYSVSITDSRGNTATGSGSITVCATLSVAAPTLSGRVGTPLSGAARASGGCTPHTFSKTSGSPAWLTVSSSGELGGTPDGAGKFAYGVTVTDSLGTTATATDTITVVRSAPRLHVPGIPATIGVEFSDTATASDGVEPYRFSKAGGPIWLSVSDGGRVWGTPDEVGNFAYSVTVTDGTGATATAGDTVYVSPLPVEAHAPPLTGTVGSPISGTATASEGWPPYTFRKESGPGWLAIADSGAISGTPTSAGVFTYEVEATDSLGYTDIDTDTITVTCPALSVDAPNLSGIIDTGVSGTAMAVGGCRPYTYSKDSGPGWLMVSGSGAISGTPTSPGSYPYSVRVTDSENNTATDADTITVRCPTLSADAPNLSVTLGDPVSGTAGASGGCAPYTYSKGSGPTWLVISSSGEISGTPTSTGNLPYEVRVTDSANNTATASGTISVTARTLTLSVPGIAATRTVAFSDTAKASGGVKPHTFSKAGGPEWLSVSDSGRVWGTSNEVGDFAYSVTVTDGAGTTATVGDTVYVSPLSVVANAPPLTGTVGSPISGTATASEGWPTYSFAKESGPDWLIISGSGAISGTPTSAGVFAYEVEATDSQGYTDTDSGTITVTCPALSASAPNRSGIVDSSVSGTATASGGCPPYTYAKASGPSWLTVSSAGALSGTPSSPGSYSYSVRVTDSQNNTDTDGGTITVRCPTLYASAPNLSVTFGDPVSGTATASGGCPSYTYEKASGPGWLSVSSSGSISGTPTSTGNFAYEVRVTDSENNTATNSGTISVTSPPLGLSVPDIAATRGTRFSATASASGGTPGYTYSRASGPNWLSVSSSGTVSGTPDEAGEFTYSVTVTDQAGTTRTESGTVDVSPPPLAASAPSLSGTVGTALSGNASASGGWPSYTYEKASGPSWLSVSSAGAISGTPTGPGSFGYSVTVTDSQSNTDTDSGTITVTCPALSASAPNLSGIVDTSVSGSASASGGCPSYTYEKASGPSWLSVSSSGSISGTPTSPGSYDYSVTVTDSEDNTDTDGGTITVRCPTLSASAPNLSVTRGNTVSGSASASGGCAPYTYEKASGPSWLSVSSSGSISGTPTSTGNFPYEVRVTDSEDNTATASGTVSVTAPPLGFSVPDIAATRGVAFSATASASGGTPGYTYARASGPNWLSVSSSGTVSGTPDEVGDFTYSATVTDQAGTTRTESGTVYVSEPPLEASAPSLSGTVGEELSGTATASGGSPPYTFSKGSGPGWLSIASNGAISGTPDEEGDFSYVAIVTDSASSSDRDTGSISVGPPPLTATAPDFTTVINISISGDASASGGTPPYSYSKASGPTWLSVSSAGAVSGTPTASGSFDYSVTVTDSVGSTDTGSGTVTVNPALSLSVPTDMVAEPDESFSYSVNASGGLTPYRYRLLAEPSWVSISSIGSLTGTPPSNASGIYTFTVRVTDATGTSVSSSASISVGAGYRRGPPGG